MCPQGLTISSAFQGTTVCGLWYKYGARYLPSKHFTVWLQVVKKMWEYIKANNLQNPKNKRKIILDDKLKKIFKPPLDMFSMNKQLSKHVYVNGAGLLQACIDSLPCVRNTDFSSCCISKRKVGTFTCWSRVCHQNLDQQLKMPTFMLGIAMHVLRCPLTA